MQIECFKRANRFIMKIQIRSTRLEWCFSVTGMFNTGLTVARDQMSDEDKTERNVGSFCSLRETVELCCLYLAATSFSAGWPVAVSAVLEACNQNQNISQYRLWTNGIQFTQVYSFNLNLHICFFCVHYYINHIKLYKKPLFLMLNKLIGQPCIMQCMEY